IKTEELDQYVKLAAEGDKASFEELYKQTYSTVYFTCLSFLKNEQDAADMTQEVYISVLDNLSTLEDHSKFLSWLNKITVNKCKNRLKAAKAVPMDMEEENQPMEENENFLPEEYITNQAKRRIVMDIMKNLLTEAQYQTVIMFYFNEFTAQEISEIMECPIGTVTCRLSAAREKIRQGVSEYENKNHDKLYTYAAAVPLLAGVLTAEASSLNVQAAAADAASITNAASIDKAANTSEGGTIRKMLKTPKTMIAAIAAAVVIIGGITAAVIATNHESAPSSGAQTRQEGQQASYDAESDLDHQQTSFGAESDQESQQASSGTETDLDHQQASSDTGETVFWLHTADWGEEKDLTGITLFNGECTAPIRLDDFDGDEHLGPYFVGHYQPIDDSYETFWDAASSYNLTELLTDQRILRGEEDQITPQHSCDEEGHSVRMHSDEDKSSIYEINLCNYSEERDISYRQIYENNWFFIEANGLAILEFGGTSMNMSTADYHDLHAILDTMIDKFGRPSYLISCDDTFLENYEKNLEDIIYILVWEQEDFVITMKVYEAFFSDTGHYVNALEQVRTYTEEDYGMYLDTLGDLVYITREAWEDGYKEYYYPQEGYGADYKTHTFYDLDDLK
ncbi:MAG: RNA polymerase sigma factor, partial [Lachnospiraceae bacterium]|nr:RNA polymerase sigma factor [Lachnospiraceae bacterium]